jgi:hypothetical protein
MCAFGVLRAGGAVGEVASGLCHPFSPILVKYSIQQAPECSFHAPMCFRDGYGQASFDHVLVTRRPAQVLAPVHRSPDRLRLS